RRRNAAEPFTILGVVGRVALFLNFDAAFGELGDGADRPFSVDPERRFAEDTAEFGAIEAGKQRFSVSGAMQRNHFAGLTGDGDDVIGRGVVDEERVPAFADGEVDGLIGASRELL